MGIPSSNGSSFTTSFGEVFRAENERIGKSPVAGLALSGGGIRSASFSLGVLQAFARRNLMSEFHYISTVSGGGYIGSSLAWWLHQGQVDSTHCTSVSDPEEVKSNVFPFGRGDTEKNTISQNLILDFIRFHSSYLISPSWLRTLFRIAAILLRNIIVSAVIYVGALSLLLYLLSAIIVFGDYLWVTFILTESASGIISWPTKWLTDHLSFVKESERVHYIISKFLSAIDYAAGLYICAHVYYICAWNVVLSKMANTQSGRQ